MGSNVIALFTSPGPDRFEQADHLDLIENKGISGDKHFGRGERQTLIIDSQSLAELGYAPGALREQVTVDLHGLQSLEKGTKVQIGEVIFEIENPCAPCSGMAKRLGEDPDLFKQRAASKRGMFARAMNSGRIQKGDKVVVLQ